MEDIDKQNSDTKKWASMFKAPVEIWIAIVLGDIFVGRAGYEVFYSFKTFEYPLVCESAILIAVNLALLYLRKKFPVTWRKFTTEKQ